MSNLNQTKPSKLFVSALALGLLMNTTISAHELDASKVLELSISKQGFTRISVEGEVIKNVFCYPYTVEENVKLNKGGHVFIVAEGLKSPIHISVATDRGITQDLKLTVTNKQPEPIILKQADIKHDNIPEILATFAKGIQPEGFKPTAVYEGVREQNNLKITPIGAWLKKNIKVVMYEVHNPSDDAITLTPEMVSGVKDKAVVLTHTQLNPDQTTRFYTHQHL